VAGWDSSKEKAHPLQNAASEDELQKVKPVPWLMDPTYN
jgi:hypothetical protein